MRGEGVRAQVERRNAFSPSRRSCTQAGTGRLRGLTPPSATRLAGLGSPPRRGPPPCRGPPATRREPARAGPPGSPPPAHTCRRVTPRAARARPSRPCHPWRPFPRAPDVARVSTGPGVNPTRRPPPRSTRSTPPPLRAPRALTPLPALSLPRALTREDTHTLRLSLTGRPVPRAPAGVLAHPAPSSDWRCAGEGKGGSGRRSSLTAEPRGIRVRGVPL